MRVLETVKIENFKSIRNQELALGRLNVFIGANGAGKSNLVQAFRFLREIVQGNLATYSLQRGADSLLYFGRRRSKFIEFYLEFRQPDEQWTNGYGIRLTPTDEGPLVVDREVCLAQDWSRFPGPKTEVINTGSKEAALPTSSNRIADHVRRAMGGYRLYHFHDTSDTAPIRAAGPLDDNRSLRPDGSNLAAYLYLLQRQHPDHFRNIEDTVRQIAPFFERFNLEPSRLAPAQIRLEWKEKGSDAYFNAASLSDGTLRFMCLATLLLQPILPALVLLDEPELGLHPAAVSLLADLMSSAASRRQVLVATQSVTLVNQFEPDQIWTVDRVEGESSFQHLAKRDLSVWLQDYGGHDGYGLGELWEKNVLGARP
jgi:predicted ATPase